MKNLTAENAQSAHRLKQCLWVVIAALLGIALIPTLGRSHLEGFTYLTETMSLLIHNISAVDPLWQISFSYFYLSRPGTIWLMAPLSALSPGSGYDLLMWLAMPVFFVSLIIVIKRWSGASWLTSLATLLALPIALEAHFFANDNVIAMTFTLCGIAVLLGRKTMCGATLAGALLSVAVLCRLDQILMIPAFTVLAVAGSATLGQAARWLGSLVVGFVIIHFAMWMIEPNAANLLNRIETIAYADALWERSSSAKWDIASFFLAFGAGLPAIYFGVILLLGRVRKMWATGTGIFHWRLQLSLLLLTYPVAIYSVTAGKYYDPRGFMTMLPFFAPLAAISFETLLFKPLFTGVASLRDWLANHGIRAAVLVFPVIVPGVLLFPPAAYETENAPLSLGGRMWYWQDWRDWQDRFHLTEMRSAETLVSLSESEDPKVIVTSDWNTDRQLQHAMIKARYQPTTSQNLECTTVSETWRSPSGVTIYHLRAHVPFLTKQVEKSAALMLAHGSACLRSVQAYQRISMTSFGPLISLYPPEIIIAREANGLRQISDANLDKIDAIAAQTLRDAAVLEIDDPEKIAQYIMQLANDLLN